jgi:membrane protein YdbS with pleckstrin-like domain
MSKEFQSVLIRAAFVAAIFYYVGPSIVWSGLATLILAAIIAWIVVGCAWQALKERVADRNDELVRQYLRRQAGVED